MSKITLLFFVHNHFHFEQQWRAWLRTFGERQVRVKIIVQHTDASTICGHSEWVQKHMVTVNVNYVTEGNPAWKSMDKLMHMYRAFSEAVAEGCTHMLIVSDQCLPVVSSGQLWNEVTRSTQSWIDVQLRPRNGYTALNQFTRVLGSVCKGDRYMLLVQDDLRLVVEEEEGLRSFSHAKYAEEMYVPTTLMRHGALQASAVLTIREPTGVVKTRECLASILDEHIMRNRIQVRVGDNDTNTAIDVRERSSIDDPSTDDIVRAVEATHRIDTCYGRVRCKKVVFSLWNNSHMYPNSYVWNEDVVSLARRHGCLFVQVIIDIDQAFWDAWITADEYTPPKANVCARAVGSDAYIRRQDQRKSQASFESDTRTAFHERVWPESECWLYAKHKLTTLNMSTVPPLRTRRTPTTTGQTAASR
jgi:hypothetical protein